MRRKRLACTIIGLWSLSIWAVESPQFHAHQDISEKVGAIQDYLVLTLNELGLKHVSINVAGANGDDLTKAEEFNGFIDRLDRFIDLVKIATPLQGKRKKVTFDLQILKHPNSKMRSLRVDRDADRTQFVIPVRKRDGKFYFPRWTNAEAMKLWFLLSDSELVIPKFDGSRNLEESHKVMQDYGDGLRDLLGVETKIVLGKKVAAEMRKSLTFFNLVRFKVESIYSVIINEKLIDLRAKQWQVLLGKSNRSLVSNGAGKFYFFTHNDPAKLRTKMVVQATGIPRPPFIGRSNVNKKRESIKNYANQLVAALSDKKRSVDLPGLTRNEMSTKHGFNELLDYAESSAVVAADNAYNASIDEGE